MIMMMAAEFLQECAAAAAAEMSVKLVFLSLGVKLLVPRKKLLRLFLILMLWHFVN